jgi:hypothetical protein
MERFGSACVKAAHSQASNDLFEASDAPFAIEDRIAPDLDFARGQQSAREYLVCWRRART